MRIRFIFYSMHNWPRWLVLSVVLEPRGFIWILTAPADSIHILSFIHFKCKLLATLSITEIIDDSDPRSTFSRRPIPHWIRNLNLRDDRMSMADDIVIALACVGYCAGNKLSVAHAWYNPSWTYIPSVPKFDEREGDKENCPGGGIAPCTSLLNDMRVSLMLCSH